MDFRLLGPLEVAEHDGPLALGGVKQRSLLALLLVHANQVVSTERMIDELWGESPPATVAKSIQVYVSRLRRLLGDDRIVTRAPGYMLRVDASELDLSRFERLVAEARDADPSHAAETLREALALWRGTPIADLAFEPFAQPVIARLEEQRIGAVEQRIDAELARGREAALIGELRVLVVEHPLREKLRSQLMLTLYRCGRQAEALEAYRAARTTFIEEVGIEPSRGLQELHQALLRQDPDLEPTRGGGAGSPRMFVGRARELADLVSILDDAFAGHGRLALLEGEPGIGKSRLAEHLAAEALARGAHVLVGRCWEAGDAPAYWPWTQALRSYVREIGEAALRAQLGSGAPDIARIVPELRERFPDLPRPSTLDREGARVGLFDATAEFLRRAGEVRPLVLVLDDLHAADPPSLLLLRFLARALPSMRMLVIGAYRHVDPRPGASVEEMLADVTREPVTRRLSLSGFSAAEVAEYLGAAASGVASPGLAPTLHERTEGNPLFLAEIVQLMTVESGAPRLPPSVRDVIARRLTHLEPNTHRLLVLASVLGREFEGAVLGRLADLPDDDVLDALDEAIAAFVVSDVAGAGGRLRFQHVLIRDTLYEGLTSPRRLQLHKAAVRALERLDAETGRSYLAEAASHALAAGDHDKCVRYAVQAAHRALGLLAYDEAARLFGLALKAVSRTVHEARGELLLAAGDALAKAGSMAESKDTFLDACELARTSQQPQNFARAALGYGGSISWQRAGGDTQLVPLLEEALDRLDAAPSLLRAKLLARLAGALRDEASLEPRASMSREAVAIARGLGDADTLAYSLTSLFMATWGPGVEDLAAIAHEVTDLAVRTGAADAGLDALTLNGIVGWLKLDQADAEAMDREFTRLAGRLEQAAPCWQVAMQDGLWALVRGDFALAEHLEEEALRSGAARSADADCSYRLAMFLVRREQGRLAEVEDLLREAVGAYPGYRAFRCLIPVLDHELGHEREARRAFAELARDEFGVLPRNGEWLFCLSLLAELAAGLGERGAAIVLYRLLEPYARVNAMAAGEAAIGPVARYLGILAATTERWHEAESQFEDAMVMNARMGARPWLAHTQDDYARMLLARGMPGDREKAAGLIAEAISTYRALGMARSLP